VRLYLSRELLRGAGQPDETHLGLLKWKRGLLFAVPKGSQGGGDDEGAVAAAAAATDGDGGKASGEGKADEGEVEGGAAGAAARKMRGPKKSGLYW